ncbi:MAG: arylesterase [Gammaproteobacteria bacterium]
MLWRTFKIRVLILVVVLSWQPAGAVDNSKTLLVLGDSLSAGYGVELQDTWVSLLQNRLTKQGYGYRVINASISGDTTGGGLRRLPRALKKHEPAIVLIELGGNDGLRGTPIATMRSNLAEMIEMAQAGGAQVILAGMQMPPNYGKAYTQEFADAYPELADEYQVALIEFFLKNVALDPAMMQPDLIHPSTKAQPLLLENVWDTLYPDVIGSG